MPVHVLVVGERIGGGRLRQRDRFQFAELLRLELAVDLEPRRAREKGDPVLGARLGLVADHQVLLPRVRVDAHARWYDEELGWHQRELGCESEEARI